ncbi:MFS transporter [Pseudomonas amygdali]|uniref:MFS transporter n=1 Tax=Pseudomonas amygdali TaxID=47877 RepID=UPI000EFF96E5|nr:MFS transporter [Pseudomonas amygdali]MBI6728472.1 MFS transporter [Pseudomonas amygdali]MBI6810268.1 MFS transporter [Pseudomonas amygdali]RMP04074.1 hypothetical protein ALQ31_04121 [Pseudomonas amygdali pv. morsprunorum]
MTATSTHEAGDADGNHVYRRITLRLIPFIFICYLFNYLDRVNVGFAKLQMLDALSFSETVYGLGAGIFFIGYVLCGLPSNLALNRFGPRRWIGLMMITWGIFSTCLLFVTTPVEFYVLRFLTGMAGWQWMFLIQGLPTVALGVLAFVLLCDKVEDARWLTPEQRQRVKTDITNDELSRPVQGKSSVASVLSMPFIWILGFIYFCIQSGVYAINFWLPSIIKNLGFSDALVIGWISAVPYLMAGVFMLLVGRSADLRNERRWHLVVPMLMGATGLIIAANFATVPIIAILGLTIATMGALTSLPMFWPLPTALLSASVAAGGLALINSIGQMAGFLSPYLVGWIKDQTGSTTLALYSLAALTIVGSLVALRVSRQSAGKVAATA